MRTTILIALAAALAGACDNSSSAAELDHEQLLAVRVTPPVIAPGETARIDVLAADAGGEPFETAPDSVSLGQVPAGEVRQVDGEWIVTAPGEEELAAVRGQLGVDDDAPVVVTAQVELDIDGVHKRADKTVGFGNSPGAPALALAALLVDGEPAPAGEVMSLDASSDHALAADLGPDPCSRSELGAVGSAGQSCAADVAGVQTYAWYASVGELSDYRSELAVIRSDEPATGHLVLVVRDQLGGVDWQVAPIAFE